MSIYSVTVSINEKQLWESQIMKRIGNSTGYRGGHSHDAYSNNGWYYNPDRWDVPPDGSPHVLVLRLVDERYTFYYESDDSLNRAICLIVEEVLKMGDAALIRPRKVFMSETERILKNLSIMGTSCNSDIEYRVLLAVCSDMRHMRGGSSICMEKEYRPCPACFGCIVGNSLLRYEKKAL